MFAKTAASAEQHPDHCQLHDVAKRNAERRMVHAIACKLF